MQRVIVFYISLCNLRFYRCINSRLFSVSNNTEKLGLTEKQQISKKQNLSWESTIAQINTLAHSKKKTKPVPVEVIFFKYHFIIVTLSCSYFVYNFYRNPNL